MKPCWSIFANRKPTANAAQRGTHLGVIKRRQRVVGTEKRNRRPRSTTVASSIATTATTVAAAAAAAAAAVDGHRGAEEVIGAGTVAARKRQRVVAKEGREGEGQRTGRRHLEERRQTAGNHFANLGVVGV